MCVHVNNVFVFSFETGTPLLVMKVNYLRISKPNGHLTVCLKKSNLPSYESYVTCKVVNIIHCVLNSRHSAFSISTLAILIQRLIQVILPLLSVVLNSCQGDYDNLSSSPTLGCVICLVSF